MYTIEYYKTKREKSEIKEPEYLSENKRMNYLMRRRYLHQKDLIDKCWNVKSLTIDLKDIDHILQDKSLRLLSSLHARVKRLKIDDSISTITILNNNDVNLSYIYEIINCKWMVNANEELNNLDVLTTTQKLVTLIDQYDKETDEKRKIIMKDEIGLIKYYMDTIVSQCNNKENNNITLKLGKHFIRKRTID